MLNRHTVAAVVVSLLASHCTGSREQGEPPPEPTPRVAPSLVIAVRHAEKVDDSEDPELSEAGRDRARALARLVRDAGIDRIFSTDFRRTRDTAAAVADEIGVPVELYDASRLDELAANLRQPGARALVVGHSNTTPALVSALGGTPGEPIDDSEYDRLYFVLIGDFGAHTSLLRFSP